MPTYLSPGVYVEEIPSGSAPIVAVGTSTAAFIGTIDSETLYTKNPLSVKGEHVGTADGKTTTFNLKKYPVETSSGEFMVNVLPDSVVPTVLPPEVSLHNDDKTHTSHLKFTTAPKSGEITVDYQVHPLVTKGEIKLCTNFTEFTKFFGDFDSNAPKGQNTFAHAVFGFFLNGGSRAYVTWIKDPSEVTKVLEKFEAIDEISLVAAPGNPDVRNALKDHCEKMGDRFAILDSPEVVDLSNTDVGKSLKPFDSDYAALYFPWIQVYDPASKGNIFLPPSGHLAGVYARVDGQRGVYKAPANVTILGALDLKYNLSKAQQNEFNPRGINCIRKLNGNILIWGARTIGGDANGEFKYINVRRLFISLKDSIDKGTQWTVFEPNDAELWANIRRNVNAYLTNVWRSGALFGTTPQEAFYVKCDAENNPPEVRDLGQVIIEIGVAPVKPAEFVIFRLSQWAR